MPQTSVLIRIRHTVARAFRETGQALDRVGLRGTTHAESRRVVNDDPYFFEIPLSRHRTLMPMIQRGEPIIENGDGLRDQVFIAPCSTIIGSVRIGKGASIWYGAILRADNCWNGVGRFKSIEAQTKWEKEKWITMTDLESKMDNQNYGGNIKAGGAIYVGQGTNVQDGAIITSKVDHTLIGDNVTIGHGAQIHSAVVESTCLIGMGAVLKPGSFVETESMVAAGAVIGEGVIVKSGELWAGNPARKLRDLTPEQRLKIRYQADQYIGVSQMHTSTMELGGNEPDDLFFRQYELLETPVEEAQSPDATIRRIEKESNEVDETEKVK
jgi:carbonic anhydrase/acetyltransferase-like protein (isoleucine patch superfamily)